VPSDRVDVVPCGVDVSLFRPGVEQNRSWSRPRLLIVGRLVPRKGVEDAIRAVALVPGVELVVVGGPAADQLDADPEVARLRRVVAECGLADRVVLTGHRAHDELPAIINASDLLLAVPWYEPFGITVLEAMACGVPVVGSAVGGLLDTVVPGVTGLLVTPRDPAEMAAAIRLMLDDEPRRAAMGRAGADRVRELYTWERVAARTEQSYRAVLRAGVAKLAAS
jgi:glycosyltransferase involved in cell wall biosynthesis